MYNINSIKNKILCGDVLEQLRLIPDNSIDCIVTSSPYWAVRNYGIENQIGLEDNPQLYIDKIVEVMKECKRIIKPTGTIFLNLGDSYYSKSGSGQGSNFKSRHEQLDGGSGVLTKAHTETRGKYHTPWLQNKQRLLIPHRIAIKCQDELGLVLRNDIHWVKSLTNWKTKESWGSSMPTSVSDRLNTVSEYIFFFVKENNYFFDLDAVRIPHKEVSLNRIKYGHKSTEGSPYAKQCDGVDMKRFCSPGGKNPGDCIMFPFEPSRLKHFAMFPSTLPDFCIKCGCPEGGIVLDPFGGGMTTALAALRLKRNFCMIELNEEYIKIGKERLMPLMEQSKLEV